MKNKLAVAAIFAMCSSMAFAEGYIGLGYGETDIDSDISDFDSDKGFEIYGGFEISEAFDFEIAYVDFGEADDNIPPNWSISGSTLSASAKGNIDVSEKLQLFGRLGFHAWDAELKEDGFGTLGEDDGTDLLIGLGLLFQVNEAFGIGGRFTKYDLDDDEVEHFTLNLQINY